MQQKENLFGFKYIIMVVIFLKLSFSAFIVLFVKFYIYVITQIICFNEFKLSCLAIILFSNKRMENWMIC